MNNFIPLALNGFATSKNCCDQRQIALVWTINHAMKNRLAATLPYAGQKTDIHIVERFPQVELLGLGAQFADPVMFLPN